MTQNSRRAAPGCNAAYYREQAEACRAIADLDQSPTHRATFLRLALHWRGVARAVDDLVVAPTDEAA